MSGSCTDVLVIGGGASGTLVAAQLLRQAAGPLRVSLVEPRHELGRGIAYGTTDPGHLLNVVAGGMSALPDEPDHFCRWAGAEPTAYLPRRRYGDYLWSVLDAARDDAAPGVVLEHVRASAVAVRPAGGGFVVDLARGPAMHARSVVIATGNGPARPLAGVLPMAGPRVIDDPWRTGALTGIPAGSTVLVAGTGLTFVDVALSLCAADPRTKVVGLSRQGLLPMRHPEVPLPPLPPLSSPPHRLEDLVAFVAALDPDCRRAVDSLRPVTGSLWRRMPLTDRRRFLDQYARRWDTVRHRMPPSSAHTLSGLRVQGRVEIRAAEIAGVAPAEGSLAVTLASGETLYGDVLVNCTGPTPDPARTDCPLLTQLLADGLARPEALGLGIDVDPDSGALIGHGGRARAGLVTLGPPRRGVLWESTAIPEIRVQARDLAARLVAVARRAAMSA